ncbi:hypothetical protein EJ06DRAFT_578537 [Trichodelitschia bisporula]|uniref:Uncharacterized protein n=1 Tax=Trichodelitschia bisporula TaxID=703511 RepID=A0A6G1IBC2_9PEZI|nr:hypothetical protein EJ06DRAFT_578537 [Trichodelitschia bisporula]
MLDPISIINVISFAFQCSELLIHGLGAVKARGKTAHDCLAKLRSYKVQLNNINIRICNWCQVWGFATTPLERGRRFDDDTLEEIWGPDGLNLIKRLLQDIGYKTQCIERKLSGEHWRPAKPKDESGRPRFLKPFRMKSMSRSTSPTDEPAPPTDEEWEEWVKHTSSLRQKSSQPAPLRDASIFFKICFAIYRNDELRLEITELGTLVTEFEQFCTALADVRLSRLSKSDMERKQELMEAECMRERIGTFTKFAQQLHQASERIGGSWSLELRVPEVREQPDLKGGDVARWKDIYDINLDFSLHYHDRSGDDKAECRRIRIAYDPSQSHYVLLDYVSESIGELTKRPSTPSPLDNLPHCQRISRPLESLFSNQTFATPNMAKVWEHDQARLLFGFVNWMVLLYNTPWTDHACCCELRFEHLPDGNTPYVLSGLKRGDCRNALVKGQKLLLLGVVLAQIILGRPLRVPIDTVVGGSGLSSPSSSTGSLTPVVTNSLEELQFKEHWSGDSTMSWEKVDRQRVLRDIAEKTSASVTAAVRYCFENPQLGEGMDFRPDITLDLIQNVLEPFSGHFDIIDSHRGRYSLTTWWRSFQRCCQLLNSRLPALINRTTTVSWLSTSSCWNTTTVILSPEAAQSLSPEQEHERRMARMKAFELIESELMALTEQQLAPVARIRGVNSIPLE